MLDRQVAQLKSLLRTAFGPVTAKTGGVPKHVCPTPKTKCAHYDREAKKCRFREDFVAAAQIVNELETELKLGLRGNPKMNVGSFFVGGFEYALNISASGNRKEITRCSSMVAVGTEVDPASKTWELVESDLHLETTVLQASSWVMGYHAGIEKVKAMQPKPKTVADLFLEKSSLYESIPYKEAPPTLSVQPTYEQRTIARLEAERNVLRGMLLELAKDRD